MRRGWHIEAPVHGVTREAYQKANSQGMGVKDRDVMNEKCPSQAHLSTWSTAEGAVGRVYETSRRWNLAGGSTSLGGRL